MEHGIDSEYFTDFDFVNNVTLFIVLPQTLLCLEIMLDKSCTYSWLSRGLGGLVA